MHICTCSWQIFLVKIQKLVFYTASFTSYMNTSLSGYTCLKRWCQHLMLLRVGVYTFFSVHGVDRYNIFLCCSFHIRYSYWYQRWVISYPIRLICMWNLYFLVNEAWICIKFVVQTVFILHPGTMKDLEKMEVLAKKVAEKSNMKKTSAEELLYDIKVLCFIYNYIYWW